MRKEKILLILILSFALLLRVYKLDVNPPSLSGDEIDLGYHAYSLFKTGRDYSGSLFPVHLQSLADYKSSLYAYFSIPTVAIFGVSSWGVRLPAAILGMLSVGLFFFLIRYLLQNEKIALVGAFFLAVSPWHLQFSRGGFEAMAAFVLLLGGLYFFLKGFREHRLLLLSAVFFGLTVWAYHAAKIFVPFFLISLTVIWRDQLRKIPTKNLLLAVLIFTIIVFPIGWNSLFAGGANRFGSTSVFSDPQVVSRIEEARSLDLRENSVFARIFHNKITEWTKILANNYLQTFSADFLFIKGDPNLRHSPLSMGEFYKFQFPFLIIGLIFLLKLAETKFKYLMIVWLLLSPLPGVLTKDGSSHAIRLIFMLPPLIFLVSSGIYYSWQSLRQNLKKIFVSLVSFLFLISFIFYSHNYWVHYPIDSQRFWQYGFGPAIKAVMQEEEKYERVIISQADEPALLFFLGYSMYPPDQFQKKYPLDKEEVVGFGLLSKLDKYYFPPIGRGIDLYSLGSILPPKTLYLATFKEINLDLIREPERIPKDIKLIKSITYPSGNPAFYLLEKAI